MRAEIYRVLEQKFKVYGLNLLGGLSIPIWECESEPQIVTPCVRVNLRNFQLMNECLKIPS